MLTLVAALATTACTTTQVDRTRDIAATSMKATAVALPLIGRVVTAYGSPYADLIVAFAEAVAPERDDEGGDDASGDADAEKGDQLTSAKMGLVTDEALRVNVDIVREAFVGAETIVIPMRDGEALTLRDNYKIQVECDRPCHAYIAQLDPTGRLDPVLPSALTDASNPLPAGRRTHDVPAQWSRLILPG